MRDAILAGFFSGDGCVCQMGRVTVLCVEPDTCLLFQERFGGTVVRKRGIHRHTYMWKSTVAGGRDFASVMNRLCVLKWKELDILLENLGQKERYEKITGVRKLKKETDALDMTNWSDEQVLDFFVGFWASDGTLKAAPYWYLQVCQKHDTICHDLKRELTRRFGVNGSLHNDKRYDAWTLSYSMSDSKCLLGLIKDRIPSTRRNEQVKIVLNCNSRHLSQTEITQIKEWKHKDIVDSSIPVETAFVPLSKRVYDVKTCTICKETKSIACFYGTTLKANKDGTRSKSYIGTCRTCYKKRNRAYYIKKKLIK